MNGEARRMAAHVDRLAARHNIRIGSHSRGGRASPLERQIDIRPVRSTVTYAIALHEIGHVVGRGRSGPRLESEAAVWRWAIRNALPGTVDHVFAAKVRESLASYRDWAVRRGQGPGCPKLPAHDHTFWTLLSFHPGAES